MKHAKIFEFKFLNVVFLSSAMKARKKGVSKVENNYINLCICIRLFIMQYKPWRSHSERIDIIYY